jgi:hypothetical protein
MMEEVPVAEGISLCTDEVAEATTSVASGADVGFWSAAFPGNEQARIASIKPKAAWDFELEIFMGLLICPLWGGKKTTRRIHLPPGWQSLAYGERTHRIPT